MLFFTLCNNCGTNQEKDPVEKYYTRILNYCKYHLNNDRTAAEECTQEVFATFYEQFHGKKIDEPKAWLYHTADNFLNRYIREQAIEKRRIVSFDDENRTESADDVLGYDPDFDSFLEKNVDIDKYADRIISALKENEQKLYNQYFLNHKSISELAKEYGVSEGAMRARIHSVKQHILKIVVKLYESEQFDSM